MMKKIEISMVNPKLNLQFNFVFDLLNILYLCFTQYIHANHKFEYGFVNHLNYQENANLILHLSKAPFREEEYQITFLSNSLKYPSCTIKTQTQRRIKNLILKRHSPKDIHQISLVLALLVKIVCKSPKYYFRVEFNWFAFNDESVQVISNLNISNPQTSCTHPYQKNCKINLAISNFESYYASGSQFNNLTVQQYIILGRPQSFIRKHYSNCFKPDGYSQVFDFPSSWAKQNWYLNFLGFKHDETDENIRFMTNITYYPEITVGIYPFNQSLLNHFCINDPYFDLEIFKGDIQSRFFYQKNQIDSHITIKEVNYSQNQNILEQITIATEIESIQIIFYWKCIDKELLKLTIFCLEEQCSSIKIKCNVKKIKTLRLQAKFQFNQISEQYIKIAKTSALIEATQILVFNNNPFEQVLLKVEVLSFFQFINNTDNYLKLHKFKTAIQ
ncbi:unnamed protein product [Paramecium octaurelia]|uniref:Uncharacterized protein n=1 Tax=Paramecium octaurelia TaxID=43137 RepID=A0A8S1WTT8_PAROT|nr:unnamed protein product [Paramecium octaurelia]